MGKRALINALFWRRFPCRSLPVHGYELEAPQCWLGSAGWLLPSAACGRQGPALTAGDTGVGRLNQIKQIGQHLYRSLPFAADTTCGRSGVCPV